MLFDDGLRIPSRRTPGTDCGAYRSAELCLLGFSLLSFWAASSLRGATGGSREGTAKGPPVAEEAPESLAALEQKIVAAAEKAKPSVVRIAWRPGSGLDKSRSGVILTADGYVATDAYDPSAEDDDLPPGKAVSVYLADGRRVPGVAVGSSLEWQFGLIKITQKGLWPHAEVGESAEVEAGEICLAVGYCSPTHAGSLPYDREPSLRVGQVVPTGMLGRLSSSCQVTVDSEWGGGGLFDLEGRLIGVNIGGHSPGSQAARHSTIEIIQQHWKELVGRKPPAKGAASGQVQRTENRSKEIQSVPLPSPDDPPLAAAVGKAWRAAVVMAPVGTEGPGVSGVVVSADGYVATCAHHDYARGTKVIVRFADGSAAPGEILGGDWLLDIGLAKITAPGPWPHAQWGSVADVRANDLCLVLGCPHHLQKGGQESVVVRVGRIGDTSDAPARLKNSSRLWNGDSGGGLFDGQGRLIGVHLRDGEAAGADLFQRHWDFLVNGPSLGDPVPFNLTPTAKAFRKAVEHVPPITVEVLGDEKRRALGTIVSADGHVLAKASELYLHGSISCRLADGRVLPAAMGKVSRQHDLALLKIDARDLPQILWSEREQIPVGSFVGALRYGEPPLVGVLALAARPLAPGRGWVVAGKVKDAEGGVEVVELWEVWKLKSPIRVGDVIAHVQGRPTPNVKTFEQWNNQPDPGVFVGDPIRVGVRRGGKELEFRFPFLSVTYAQHRRNSLRKVGFPAVFDTDALITPDACGGPVVDRTGQVVGITIAMPTEHRVYVVPAAIARKLAEQLEQ